MRTIAIINQKGGSGKTTVSINLAAALARSGRRTLLVDMDPQSHCALGLAVPEGQIERSTADLLRTGLSGALSVPDVVWHISRNLDLAPASMALAAIEAELANVVDRDRRLGQILSTVDDDYDFCIVDCPPAIGLLTFNALRAAGEVIVPVETGYFALQGSIRQEATIDMLARRAQHHVRFHVLATMYDVKARLSREILAEMQRHFGARMLPMVVNYSQKLKEAASFGQPISEYDPDGMGMADFHQLAQWLLEHQPSIPVPPPIEPGSPEGQSSAGHSRAAELVERARALAQRSAALTSQLERRDAAATPTPGATRPAASASRPEDDAFPAQAPGADDDDAPDLRVAGGARTILAPAPRPASTENADNARRLSRSFGVRVTRQGLLFVQPDHGARTVQLAGDFNDWSPDNTPLRFDADLGVWQTCLDVPAGRYRYRLVIDGQWAPDPYNQRVEANAFGEINSIVEVDRD